MEYHLFASTAGVSDNSYDVTWTPLLIGWYAFQVQVAGLAWSSITSGTIVWLLFDLKLRFYLLLLGYHFKWETAKFPTIIWYYLKRKLFERPILFNDYLVILLCENLFACILIIQNSVFLLLIFVLIQLDKNFIYSHLLIFFLWFKPLFDTYYLTFTYSFWWHKPSASKVLRHSSGACQDSLLNTSSIPKWV